jgi:hypothetical protein
MVSTLYGDPPNCATPSSKHNDHDEAVQKEVHPIDFQLTNTHVIENLI